MGHSDNVANHELPSEKKTFVSELVLHLLLTIVSNVIQRGLKGKRSNKNRLIT